MREGANEPIWLLSDHLDSTTVTANASGTTKLSELRYKPWGKTRYTFGTTPTQRHFTGQIEDEGIGLYYYGARYYDPVLGRFIQPDTIVPEAGNPLAYDRFDYSYNNPVKHTDRSGHIPCDEYHPYCPGDVIDPYDILFGLDCYCQDPWAQGWTSEHTLSAVESASFFVIMVSGGMVAESMLLTIFVPSNVGAGLSATTLACADQNCTNEVGIVSRLGQYFERVINVASGHGGRVADMRIVRTIGRGEKVTDLIEEIKGLTYTTGVEHAIVKLKTGERVIVRGGPEGINMQNVQRLILHTHPYDVRGTGRASLADKWAPRALGQTHSWILAHGNLFKFRVDD